MHKKNLSHLLEPSFRLYFLFLAAFVVAAVGAGAMPCTRFYDLKGTAGNRRYRKWTKKTFWPP